MPRQLWQEPFVLMSAPETDFCVVPACKSASMSRWEVEVVGYHGHGNAPDEGPKFTVCSSHLTQQLNRYTGKR